MALLSNLYPPIMPSVIPSFVRTSTCKIYFSISEYNSFTDILNVQISLIDIETNTSAFDSSLYPVGIKLAELKQDSQIEDDYRYYIEIKASDLANHEFKLNKYYKVQLRFTSTNAKNISLQTPQAISAWLSQNIQHFSEWSRSCLIRGISQPIINLNNLIKDKTVTLDTPLIKVIGKLVFQDAAQTDYLTEYNIKIYANKKVGLQNAVFDSGTIYSNNNIIDCDILYSFLKEIDYTLCFSYKTSCLYNQQNFYYFNINQNVIPDPYNIKIKTTANNEDGYINIDMTLNTDKKPSESVIGSAMIGSAVVIGNDSIINDNISTNAIQGLAPNELMIVYRSSSRDNFCSYEKIYSTNKLFPKNNWQDLSIENGIWYKYIISIINDEGKVLYTPVETDPVICVFEDIFLTHGGIQFRLKFNPTISSFKYNVTESSQITIGSKYPFVKRNGKNFYRTFSVSGLISSLIDESEWYEADWQFDSLIRNNEEKKEQPKFHRFASKQDIYQDSYDLYENYENQHNISSYLNPLYERLFREMVYDFLYKDEAKLFRSPTEGNILVYLSDITFEPVFTLGRILYSFSATATEIDEANFENCVKYNIMPFSTYDLVTEAPSFNIIKRGDNLVLVIEAYGATQKADQNWTLHLEEYNTSHNINRG